MAFFAKIHSTFEPRRQELLKARIGIRTLYCPDMQIKAPVTVNGKNYFDVVFVRPINPQPAADQHFVDALNFGDPYTYLEIAKLTNLNDWRFPDPVASFATHANYWSYYGVTNITADVANIKTDLNQAAGVKVPVTNYPDLKVAYVNSILKCNFDTIDVGSFVSPKAICIAS